MTNHHGEQALVVVDPERGTGQMYVERFDESLTLYRSQESNDVVGAVIDGTSLAPIVRALMGARGDERRSLRQLIADFLLRLAKPEGSVDEFVSVCTTQGGPDGLDLAIDVLARTGKLVVDYAQGFVKRHGASEDGQYVLLRAVARTSADAAARFDILAGCAAAPGRGVREGVVEGLADLATPEARKLLQTLAQTDPDDFIRKTAAEALTDLES